MKSKTQAKDKLSAPTEDEVLKRMLLTPPTPHKTPIKAKPKKRSK